MVLNFGIVFHNTSRTYSLSTDKVHSDGDRTETSHISRTPSLGYLLEVLVCTSVEISTAAFNVKRRHSPVLLSSQQQNKN